MNNCFFTGTIVSAIETKVVGENQIPLKVFMVQTSDFIIDVELWGNINVLLDKGFEVIISGILKKRDFGGVRWVVHAKDISVIKVKEQPRNDEAVF